MSRGCEVRLFRSLWRALPCVLLALPLAAGAQPRTLDWPALEVVATLDSSGTLFVQERQTIRFNGDWNGGERRFNVNSGQRLDFARLLRIDTVTGDTVSLVKGDLDEVDRYSMSGTVLRWRSRLPEDPPFQDTELVYLLEYSYRNILRFEDPTYLLDHDFAFRDRNGVIDNYTLRVELDTLWGHPEWWTGSWTESRLEPGQSFVVTVPLRWQGAGLPSAVWHGTARPARLAILALLIGCCAAVWVRFNQVEHAAQRFIPPVPDQEITPEWLDTHLFSLLPEVAGAAWDDKVGSPEVAAVLARMVGEGKLSSRVESGDSRFFRKHVLHLTLLVEEHDLESYERALVSKLFVGSGKTTDTETIRETYARSGFDPTIIVRGPLRRAVETIPDAGPMGATLSLWRIPVALAAGGLGLIVAGGVVHVEDAPFALLSAVLALAVFLFAMLQAHFWRRRVLRPWPHALRFLLPLVLIVGLLLRLIFTGEFRLGPLTLGGLSLVALAYVVGVLNNARSRYSPERMRFRKRLASAREYFARELRKPQPQLDDAWYPYLLAFGLGPQVDKWFKSFGAAVSGSATASMASSSSRGASGMASSSLGSAGDGRWSGFSGGGGFAGGGATVAFGAAVGGMAATVSPPSSSGSSGGGSSSSSSSSSGGGGGGGW